TVYFVVCQFHFRKCERYYRTLTKPTAKYAELSEEPRCQVCSVALPTEESQPKLLEEEESTEEVKIEVLHRPENCSKTSKKGDLLNAHYDGFLAKDGSKFYCSRTQNEGHPKWFVLGVGQVIKGLDIAMMEMCPGEKRKVIIPPSLAYGKKGYGST
uniref:peptidylprolyl isomerase n=1 Tax=Rhinolophus ferrumequinum TaxID=59479 RepID=A0A671G6W4_RHIFE